eukprot:TRINITY_DN16241_c0_g1_i1.p1 TRINITY_DN16241_c0_g1~~TRINITY_DN16241_c0_g1_i1.p1  ORF type:complete len:396 (+),score=64.01 TRINITY_DN16241_c0_g1_i1:96-1190(+)
MRCAWACGAAAAAVVAVLMLPVVRLYWPLPKVRSTSDSWDPEVQNLLRLLGQEAVELSHDLVDRMMGNEWGEGDIELREHELGSREVLGMLHMPQPPQSGAVPLVVSMHAFGSTPSLQRLMTGLSDLGDSSGFAVLYPSGGGVAPFPLGVVGRAWNAGSCCPYATTDGVDDVARVRRAVAAAIDSHPGGIDPARIYVTGMSNGGFMTNRLACEAADLFAAAASVSGTLVNRPGRLLPGKAFECNPQRPVPMLHFHGTADPIVPHDGNEHLGIPTLAVHVDGWVKRNGAAGIGTIGQPGLTSGDVRCRWWGPAGRNVTLCTVTGGGHSWPGAPWGCRSKTGPMACSRDADASQLIWDFLKHYRLE